MATVSVSKSIRTEVEVEVELSDFDDDDLLEEFASRVDDEDYSKEDLRELYIKISIIINESNCESLDDKMKTEHFHKVKDKYTSWQMESLLPDK